MSIYKMKFRCVECNHLWIENVDRYDTLPFIKGSVGKCKACGGDELKLSLYSDSIVNIDDDIKFDDDVINDEI